MKSKYKIPEWKKKTSKSWFAYIYLACDIQNVKTKIRELCFPSGLCVTVEEVDYIYAGGLESGCRVGIIQYPRFEEDEKDLLIKSINLGKALAENNYQWSFTIVTPNETHFFSRKAVNS